MSISYSQFKGYLIHIPYTPSETYEMNTLLTDFLLKNYSNNCYGLNVYIPSKFTLWDPNAGCDGVRRRCLGHEGGVVTNGISAFTKKNPLNSPAPPTLWRYEARNLEDGPHPTTLASWSQKPRPQNCEISFVYKLLGLINWGSDKRRQWLKQQC